ncbi:MAG: OmpH family outer membrane protein [Bacteroidales bacterium]|nr:OmpH family outer membrane protein [Lentimicrobiaceae bacterium]MDD5693683.1 OmpH family outer membrane protein [Bacteroidales bacterium]
MKTIIKTNLLATALILCTAFTGLAQKYAFVDTEYILKNIPEYNDAQSLLDDMAAEWQKEIEDKYTEIDQLYKSYQAEVVLLPEEMKKKREDEIIKKEQAVKELQRQRFGKDGDLFKKRQELIKPIQEKIYNAIEEMAVQQNYAIIFDKAGSLSMLYANEKYDLSDDVLTKLGYSFDSGK